MTTRRDEFGRTKRDHGNRDVRRAHFIGAMRRVTSGNAKPEDFGTRMKNALLRFFAV